MRYSNRCGYYSDRCSHRDWGWLWKVGLALLLIFFIVIGVVAYMKYRKGSLRLELTTTSFREGDTLKGTLNVKARKALHAEEITARVWCVESWEEFDGMAHDHDYHDRYYNDRHGNERSEVIYSVPEVTVSGPVDFAKGETKRFEVTINIPKDIKLQMPSYTRQRSGSYSYRDSRPFTRNHRQQWYAGAELHTGGLNLDDQRSIHVDH